MNHEDADAAPEISDHDAAEWLRAQRPQASPHRLDEIKQRAISQAGRSRPALRHARRGGLATAASAAVLVASLTAGFAIAGQGPPASPSSAISNGSAASEVYKPGKGCGDKNHVHEREDECKKTPR